MSTQLYSPIGESAPQPLLEVILRSSRPGANKLVATLCRHLVVHRSLPQAHSILSRLGHAAKSVLLLPYYSLAFLFSHTDTEASPLALGDHSLHLLLLLTQHLPPAVRRDGEHG